MWFYRSLRVLFRVVALPMFRFRVNGVEQVPRKGPGVIVAPHRSWLDPACVAGAIPRPVRFLIMERVYERPASRWFYRRMRSIPVRPGGGAMTTVALRSALRALGAGHLIGVFPEGRVFPEGPLARLNPGAAMLAIRAQAPVIPVHITGSAQAWPHGRSWPGPAPVSVRIGKSIQPPRETDRAAIESLLSEIESSLEGLAAGVPS